jgi:Aspartyl protease/PDZ domain
VKIGGAKVKHIAAVVVVLITLTAGWSQAVPDHKFYSAPQQAVIPFDLYKNQIFVPMQVNGSRPLWFILDTGANTAALDETIAQELGLKPEGGGATQGVGSNDVQMKFLKNIKFGLPDLEFFDDEIITLDYRPNFAFQGRDTDGIFSYDFLKRFVVTIDYEKRLLIVTEPDAAVQNDIVQSGAELFPLTFQHGLPYVAAEIAVPGNPPQQTTFLVDVGSGDTVDWPKLAISKGKLLDTVSGVGLGSNEQKGFTGRGMLRLGRFEFKEIPIHCCGGNELGNHLIGGELLRRFKVTLDFPHQRMMLVSNSDVSRPFPFDCSGLILRQERDSRFYRIKTVIPGSPAAETGLDPSDLVEQINGIPAKQWTLEALEQALTEPGRTFDLVVSNPSGEKKSVKLLTRTLI